MFISELFIIDFVRTDKFILIRPNYKLILFFLVGLIIITLILNLGVPVTVVSGVSHKEHAPYDSVLLSML